MFTKKKREDMTTFVCSVSLNVAETPKTLTKDHEPPLSIIPFGIVAYTVLSDNLSRNSCISDSVKLAFDGPKR